MVLIYRSNPCLCSAGTVEWWHLSGVVVDVLGPALVPVGQQLDGRLGRAEPQQLWSFLVQETVIVKQVLVQHDPEGDTEGRWSQFYVFTEFLEKRRSSTQRIQQGKILFYIPVKMKKIMIKMKTSPGNKGTTAVSSFAPFRHEHKRGQGNLGSNLLVLSCRYKGMLGFNYYIYEVCYWTVYPCTKAFNGVT